MNFSAHLTVHILLVIGRKEREKQTERKKVYCLSTHPLQIKTQESVHYHIYPTPPLGQDMTQGQESVHYSVKENQVCYLSIYLSMGVCFKKTIYGHIRIMNLFPSC